MTEPSTSARAGLYMGAPVPLTTLANGAVTNADAQQRLARTSYLEPTIDRVAPGVTVFGGDGFLNLTMIEGDGGVIVYDTGEVLADGERLLRQIRAITDKPVCAVIYSHSHYVAGTSALIGDGEGVPIIGHPRVNDNLATGGAGSTYAETAPLQSSRTLQQFNHYVERQGPDAAAGAALNFGRSGFLPVNTPVSDGQRMTVAGVEMQFFTRFGSDTDDCLTVWLPQTGVALNNFFWPFMPNVYTLRGSKFRDPRDWRGGLEVIRNLQPTALVNTHARALTGRDAVRAALDDVIDALNLVLDQTLRGILRGLGPDELRSFVKLPAHLARSPNLAEVYGEISHFGPYVYHHALGWFDGDAATIDPLPPHEQAQRLVEAMGGADAVLPRAHRALADGEIAWALQLVSYLYRLDPSSRLVRDLKADALQAMGRVTPAHTVRSWCMSQARALRGQVAIPLLQFPNTRVLSMSPPAVSIEQYRVRVDPARSADLDLMLVISVTDRDARHALHLRRGVVEFVAVPDDYRRTGDVEIATDFDNWLRFFSCKRSLQEFLAAVVIVRGDADQGRRFFEVFDYYDTAANPILGT